MDKSSNKLYLEENKDALEKISGGLIPDWDAGENGLHYYFLYTEHTSELEKINNLLDEQDNYRKKLGVNKVLEDQTYNLCPYLKGRDERGE